jgi:hypothetical protein
LQYFDDDANIRIWIEKDFLGVWDLADVAISVDEVNAGF